MSAMQSTALMELTQSVVAGTAIVTPRGELDLLTAPALTERLDALTAEPFPDVVVDLRAVPFIDCSGLSTLCRARSRVLGRDGRLRLVSDCPVFRRILFHAGLADAFEVLPRLPGPLAGAVSGGTRTP
ncbi:STAS domain-containing protein [Streptomyces sp. NPDC005931]|uniref:STAS domain-containing protein n=1 Tax=Streptomyces sp. NPDC005931 TaxID=3364737 RepID=UPI00367917F1